jgi:hypothetical protein
MMNPKMSTDVNPEKKKHATNPSSRGLTIEMFETTNWIQLGVFFGAVF